MVIAVAPSAAEPFRHPRLVSRGLPVCCMAAVMAALIVAGCSDRPPVPFGTVRGRVTWKGEPLADALVIFQPEKGRPSAGRTSKSGEYELRYKDRPWGAIVGRHTVRITTERVMLDDQTASGGGVREDTSPEILPAKFHSATELKADVARGANRIDFDLRDE